MRRALIPSAILIAALAASGAAMAQTRTQAGGSSREEAVRPVTADGLRYLSWPGKASSSAPAAAASRPAPATSASAALPLTRIASSAPTSPRRGLTPASHWLPAPSPPIPVAAPPAALPDAPQPSAAVSAVSAPTEPAADPLAPRRDAPIFRLQAQAAASEAAPAPPAPVQTASIQTAQNAPVLGARLYSVHRQAGLKPDPIPATQPIYLDGLPIEMIQPPASADLAQPDAPPTLLRNSDGSLRAAPQTQEDALP